MRKCSDMIGGKGWKSTIGTTGSLAALLAPQWRLFPSGAFPSAAPSSGNLSHWRTVGRRVDTLNRLYLGLVFVRVNLDEREMLRSHWKSGKPFHKYEHFHRHYCGVDKSAFGCKGEVALWTIYSLAHSHFANMSRYVSFTIESYRESVQVSQRMSVGIVQLREIELNSAEQSEVVSFNIHFWNPNNLLPWEKTWQIQLP